MNKKQLKAFFSHPNGLLTRVREYMTHIGPAFIRLMKGIPSPRVMWSHFVNFRQWSQGKNFKEIFHHVVNSKHAEVLFEKIKRFLESLFHVQSRPKIHRVFVWIFIISASYSGGKLLAYLLRPLDETESVKAVVFPMIDPLTEDEVRLVAQNNFFKSKMATGSGEGNRKIIDERIPCLEAQNSSTFPFQVVHVVLLQDSTKSLVAIKNGGETDIGTYREGDKVGGIAKIGRIEADTMKVIFKNLKTGECEYVAFNDEDDQHFTVLSPEAGKKLMNQYKVKGVEVDGNRFVITRSLLDEKMSDVGTLLSQARAVPITNPDGSLSFKVTEIEPGSIYSVLGLEDEDKITHINGKPITGLNQVTDLFARIRDIDDLKLSVVKENGEEREMNYHLSQ